ncbi:MAG: hypothetical protein HQL35_09215 [Alphaproteobacteria bacterium]|nr:hypothetical protein [Alphaproteobacteria bacterium]
MDVDIIIYAVVSVAVGGGAFLAFRFISKKSKSTRVTQIGNKVGGDMAGRDINKR